MVQSFLLAMILLNLAGAIHTRKLHNVAFGLFACNTVWTALYFVLAVKYG